MTKLAVHLGADGQWADGPSAAAAAVSPAVPQGSGIRIGGITSRAGSGESGDQGHTAVQFGHDSGTAGGSVVATLRTSTGLPSVELEPGNPASRTSVEVAMRQGLIRLDSQTGQYLDLAPASFARPEAAAEQPGTQQEQQPVDPGAAYFDAEDDALWAEDISPLPQRAYDSAVASTVTAVALGTDPSRAIESLSQGAGIGKALAAEYIEQGVAYHQRAADKALAPLLASPDDVAAFRQHLEGRPDEFARCIRMLVLARDAGPLLDAARAFADSRRR